jgi:tetratricopeptide (TPR) repeat protein
VNGDPVFYYSGQHRKKGSDIMKRFDKPTILSVWALIIFIVAGCAKIHPPSLDSEAYNNRGVVYYNKGQYDKAIADFNRALKIEPRHFWAYHNRGRTYISKYRLDKAIADFSKALELNPRDASTYYFRGVSYLGKYQNDKAILDFSQAIEINTTFAMAYEMRAHAYLGLAVEEVNWESAESKRLNDEATSDFKKAEEIDPTIAEDEKNRGLGYRSDVSNEFIFPAVVAGYRQRAGDLVLGLTIMKQAVNILPPWPGHGPHRVGRGELALSPTLPDEVLRKVKYLYSGMGADFMLGFDKNKKLVLIDTSLSSDRSAQEKMTNMINQYQLKEVSRNSNEIRMRGEIMPCVTMEVPVPIAGDKPIEGVDYFFTCPTK